MPGPDTERFAGLIEPQLPSLYRAAYRLTGNADDAEDLVQDTCRLALERPSGLQASMHPDRWLLRVLYNRFVDGLRRRKRSPVVRLHGTVVEDLPVASGDPGPEDLAELADRERAFDCAWLKLDRTQRALLTLRAEGYALNEIEDITGISHRVLRARLHRARQSLARHLETPDERADEVPGLRRSQ